MTDTISSPEQAVYLDFTKPLEARVEDALGRMTLEEKVAVCHAQGKFSSPGVPRLGIPELWMSDGPHGVRAEICWNTWDYAGWSNDAVTAFPALTALAATWSRGLAGLYGRCVGREARYRHKDVLLGPGLNIYRTPLGGRNFEYFSEDPFLTGELAVHYIRALQDNGVAACVKHFALNNQEKWRGNIEVEVDERALREIYLPAFRRAVTEGGAWCVMGAYNKVWGHHCCHNPRLLNDILRGEWGFDGVVISDWGGTHSTDEAALGGLDIEMGSFTNGLTSEGCKGFDDYYLGNPYLEKLRSGELPVESVDAKARNVLRLIFRTAMNPSRSFGALNSGEHYAAAKAIADESIVLLKNEGLLPLDPMRAGRVLVVGENAVRALNRGGGSSELKVKDMFSPLDALREIFADVAYEPGYRSGRPLLGEEEAIDPAELDALRRKAVEAARRADTVIYIGGLNKNAFQDCESTDRRDFNLPWGQNRLIEELSAACPRLVVANITGNAYAMPWIDRVPAVVQSWYLGTMTGPAMADVLTGRVNPSGKLPFSFPVRLDDCAAHHFGEISYPGVESDEVDGAVADLEGADVGVGRNPRQVYRESIFTGYRWHESMKIKPLFPFGHGLSYTTFSYGPLELAAGEIRAGESLRAGIDITNTGNVEGSETVQLYVTDCEASLPRPVCELKDFAKVRLAPGETRRVEFVVSPSDLMFYDDRTGRWTLEPGEFMLSAGASVSDIRSRASVVVVA